MKRWNIEELTGYKPITTFYEDFSIADNFNTEAIRDTYKNVIECWSEDYKYLTEIVMVLNWKIWEHYNSGNEKYAKVYDELWRKADKYALDNLKGEELKYYIRTTD